MHGQRRTGGQLSSASRFNRTITYVPCFPSTYDVPCTSTTRPERDPLDHRDDRPAVGAVHLPPRPVSRDPRHLQPRAPRRSRAVAACTCGPPAVAPSPHVAAPVIIAGSDTRRSIVSQKMQKGALGRNDGIIVFLSIDRSKATRTTAQGSTVADQPTCRKENGASGCCLAGQSTYLFRCFPTHAS